MCQHKDKVLLPVQPRPITADACMASELLLLWALGVRTITHCCGHGEARGMIVAPVQDACLLRALGYEPLARGGGPVTAECTECEVVPVSGHAGSLGLDPAAVARVSRRTMSALYGDWLQGQPADKETGP